MNKINIKLENSTIKEYSYYQSLCFETCRYREFASQCGKAAEYDLYSDYYYTNVTMFSIFFFNMLSGCPQEITSRVEAKFRNLSVHKVCETLCPIECNSIRFETRIYQLDMSHRNTKRAIINIFYESLNVKLINQIPMFTLEDLASNIGGTLGLFLGVSIISIAEMCELVANLIYFNFLSLRKFFQVKNSIKKNKPVNSRRNVTKKKNQLAKRK